MGDDTTLAQIIRLVDEATSSKAPIAKLADKVSGVFVPIVIAIAVIAAIVWLLAGYGLEFALSIGISVLVISCACGGSSQSMIRQSTRPMRCHRQNWKEKTQWKKI